MVRFCRKENAEERALLADPVVDSPTGDGDEEEAVDGELCGGGRDCEVFVVGMEFDD